MRNFPLNLILFSLLLFFQISLQAQDNNSNKDKEEEEEGNCVREGMFIFDGYYGYPYIVGSYIKTVFNADKNNTTLGEASVVSVKNINHIGGKFEYMVNDIIGIGLEYSYAGVFMKYNSNYTEIENGVLITKRGLFDASLTKQRILGKVNFHFETSKKLDSYATIGIGYKTSILKSNNLDDALAVAVFNSSFSNFIPVAIRMGAGLRFFFTKNIGLNIEAGIGGPLVQAGLSGKF
jgi:hypothetical protein